MDAITQAFPWHGTPAPATQIGPEAQTTYVGDKRWILFDPRNNQLAIHYHRSHTTTAFPVLSGILSECFAIGNRARLQGHLAGFLSIARMEWNKATFRNNPFGDLVTIHGRGFVKVSDKGHDTHAVLRMRQNDNTYLAHAIPGATAGTTRPPTPYWIWTDHDPRSPNSQVATNLMANAPPPPSSQFSGYPTPHAAVQGAFG
ncbi:MAG: hypothetical protein ACYTFG_13865 [Planctomycetota bacterium]